MESAAQNDVDSSWDTQNNVGGLLRWWRWWSELEEKTLSPTGWKRMLRRLSTRIDDRSQTIAGSEPNNRRIKPNVSFAAVWGSDWIQSRYTKVSFAAVCSHWSELINRRNVDRRCRQDGDHYTHDRLWDQPGWEVSPVTLRSTTVFDEGFGFFGRNTRTNKGSIFIVRYKKETKNKTDSVIVPRFRLPRANETMNKTDLVVRPITLFWQNAKAIGMIPIMASSGL